MFMEKQKRLAMHSLEFSYFIVHKITTYSNNTDK